jgi:hypothetical protein
MLKKQYNNNMYEAGLGHIIHLIALLLKPYDLTFKETQA